MDSSLLKDKGKTGLKVVQDEQRLNKKEGSLYTVVNS